MTNDFCSQLGKKVIAEDQKAEGHAIAALGADSGNPDEKIRLIGNTIVSNLCNVRFGDNYGHGGRYHFLSNAFARVGNDPRYKTIRLSWDGWKYETSGHVFIDTEFEGGAGYDSGDVTDSHRLWVRPKVASNVSSPVFHDGHIFSVHTDDGVVSCVHAASGELVFRERLRPSPGRIYTSPLAADGKIYLVSRERGAYVLSASPKFEQLTHNVIENDDSIFNVSLVVSRGQLLLRSDKYLYCIGEK